MDEHGQVLEPRTAGKVSQHSLQIPGREVQVLNPAAEGTDEVVMAGGGRVVARRLPGDMKLDQVALLDEAVKHPVNRTEADVGQVTAHVVVDTRRVRMILGGAHDVQHHLALAGVAGRGHEGSLPRRPRRTVI